MQEFTMPIKSRVKVLLAEVNLERTRAGQKPISVRQIAEDTGITHSALVKLVNNKSGMVSFETLDKLMKFFNVNSLDAILEYTPMDKLNEARAELAEAQQRLAEARSALQETQRRLDDLEDEAERPTLEAHFVELEAEIVEQDALVRLANRQVRELEARTATE